MAPLNTKNLLVLLFIIAIIPPLVSLIISNPPPPPDSDAFDFHQIAIGLLEGRGFNSNATLAGVIKMPNTRHPLYPLFIAVIYLCSGNNLMVVKLIQILLHGLTCIIICLIAKELFKNELIGFIAGIIWALYPLSIHFSTCLLSETLFTFFLAMLILFLLRNWESPNFKNGFLSGLVIGLAVLTKSLVLAFVPVIFIWQILSSDKYKLMVKIKNFSIIVLFMVLTLSPWLVRNYIVLGQPLPIATEGGFSFYRYNNEKTLDVIYTPIRVAFPFTEEQIKKMSTLSEAEIDKYLHRLSWQFIKSHPKDFLKIRLMEVHYFWHLWPASPKRFTKYHLEAKQEKGTRHNVFLERFLDRFESSYFLYFCKILYHIPYNLLFLGMFISFFISFRKNRAQWKKSILLFLLIATVSGIYIFFHGTDRYRMPIDPYVFILGLHGVVSFCGGFKK